MYLLVALHSSCLALMAPVVMCLVKVFVGDGDNNRVSVIAFLFLGIQHVNIHEASKRIGSPHEALYHGMIYLQQLLRKRTSSWSKTAIFLNVDRAEPCRSTPCRGPEIVQLLSRAAYKDQAHERSRKACDIARLFKNPYSI
ncbi:hypothetical protein VNO77_31467 [Canavalia gladiata]|uniref:Uncharacterized protein n=1 Tax=Canavalia gladiata TaxID=3824 RepID=A0AAN9KQD8_CANGL